ncbi:hypothetical protein C9374_007029 [Naegleria lovaniensis]|uniref:Uncharacterized protein n=1 Tax=Naegleria lovaniensis TaxID=51637 RepID=A0AA88GYR2_NAELO|nr:uncharacterized protein C9374_007029 [Naegleria lovaniensis]KAG2393498.1 hypothetical protein C9374_007029 [Naegleria lovaniensis]
MMNNRQSKNNYIKPTIPLIPNLEVAKGFKDPSETIRKRNQQSTTKKSNKAIPTQAHSSTLDSKKNDSDSSSTVDAGARKRVKKIFTFNFSNPNNIENEVIIEEPSEHFSNLELIHRKLTNHQIKECVAPYSFVSLNKLYQDCVTKDEYDTYNLYSNWCTIFTIMEELPSLTCQAKGIEFNIWRVSDNLNDMCAVLLVPISENTNPNKKENIEELARGQVVILANPIILQINRKETDTDVKNKNSTLSTESSPVALVAETKTTSFKIIGKAKHYGTCAYVPIDFNKYTGNNLKLLSMLNEKKKRKHNDDDDVNENSLVSHQPQRPMNSSSSSKQPHSFCSCPINTAVSRYCLYHFNKKMNEVQNSRVECNGSNIVDKVANAYEKPTVYNYFGVTLFIDPTSNIKKLARTHSDEKPKDLPEMTKKKPKPKVEGQVTNAIVDHLATNSRSAKYFVAARSALIKQDLLSNAKTKNLTDKQMNLVARNAVMKTMETAQEKSQPNKRKVVEIEMSESESDDEN